jgi:methylase of polypeptide subunit release factors
MPDLFIPHTPSVFLPDQWTKAFATGLMTQNWSGHHVVEVGVGSGIVMAGVMTCPQPPHSYIGLDICDDAICSSKVLANQQDWTVDIVKSDLLSSLNGDELTKMTRVIACIPQVPADLDLQTNDNSSHYYNPNGSYWDQFGLGLNEKLLAQIREANPNCEVILNLSGRPNLKTLQELFAEAGFTSTVIHQEMVRQHEGTSLRSLADLESTISHHFEFYADAKGTKRINATEAEERRINGQEVYHKIYVLHGRPEMVA